MNCICLPFFFHLILPFHLSTNISIIFFLSGFQIPFKNAQLLSNMYFSSFKMVRRWKH